MLGLLLGCPQSQKRSIDTGIIINNIINITGNVLAFFINKD